MKADPKTLWTSLEALDPAAKPPRTSPYMLLLFPKFAKYIAEGKRTPLEALAWLAQFIKENNDVT